MNVNDVYEAAGYAWRNSANMSAIPERQEIEVRRVPGTPTVMLVEDEALIAFSLEEAFQDEGFVVVGPFSSCADAIKSLVGQRPDVAVVDATLSDGSCLELARQLLDLNVPFLIYSGRNAIEERAPELAGVEWIDKPAPPALVIKATLNLLPAERMVVGS
jgi:DNA-binding response OmpR family regulator